MRNKQNKKGFTLVELLVVIAIIAILATVSVIGYLSFTKKAKISNDIGLVTQLNTILIANEAMDGKNKTMFDAIEDVKENGYDVESMTPTTEKYNIVWDEVEDKFLLLDDKDVKVYSYEDKEYNTIDSSLWKVFDTIPEPTNKFSIYLKDVDYSGDQLNLNLKTGLDLGSNQEAFNITYKENLPKVVIRTSNSNTKLELDTTSDVYHYGPLGELKVTKVNDECYYEFGKTIYAALHKGTIKIQTKATINIVEAITDQVKVLEQGGSAKKAYSKEETITTNMNAKEGKKFETKPHTEIQNEVTIEKEEAILNETAKGEVAITSSEAVEPVYCSLAEFRDEVNKGTSFKGKTITLQKNIDLAQYSNWEPIGTIEHPFDGHFNGNNRIIKNLKMEAKGKLNKLGLFGYIEGTENALYSVVKPAASYNSLTAPNEFDVKDGYQATWDKLWDGTTFQDSLIESRQYTCIVENIHIDGANVKNTEDSGRNISALVGHAYNAYVGNCTLKNAIIDGYKYTASFVGFAANSVMNNLVSDSTVTIKGINYNGGIGGEIFGTVVMNCINNAEITTPTKPGEMAGITCRGEIGTLFYNNVNNSNITSTSEQWYIAGINSYATNAVVHIKSVNNGNISGSTECTTTSQHCIGGIQGINNNQPSRFYDCVNNGNISGKTSNMGGLVGRSGGAGKTWVFSNSFNKGILTNNYAEGKTGNIAPEIQGLTLTDKVFADVAELQEYINTAVIALGTINFAESVRVTDTTGILIIPENLKNITSVNKLANGIKIANPEKLSTFTINIPNVEYIVEAGEKLLNLNVKLYGKENKALVKGEINFIGLGGLNSILTVNANGFAHGISMYEGAKEVLIEENGKAEYVSFWGTKDDNFTLTNRGEIVADSKGGFKHTVSAQCPSTITINNYGLIEAKNTDTDPKEFGYALLFYDKCTVNFNAYAGSTISVNHQKDYKEGYLFATPGSSRSAFKVVMNVQEGAKLLYNAADYSWDTFKYRTNKVIDFKTLN